MTTNTREEDAIDYVTVHRELGTPRYTVKFWLVRLTTVEAFVTAFAVIGVWKAVETLGLSNRSLLGIISWEWAWALTGLILVTLFSVVHLKRPDLKVLELLAGAFQPTQYADMPDKKWRGRKTRKK